MTQALVVLIKIRFAITGLQFSKLQGLIINRNHLSKFEGGLYLGCLTGGGGGTHKWHFMVYHGIPWVHLQDFEPTSQTPIFSGLNLSGP